MDDAQFGSKISRLGHSGKAIRPERMSALGQKRTYAVQQPMSALLSIATAKADFPQKAMSALPPKADMCSATRDVRFVPKADIPPFIRSPRRRDRSAASGTLRPSALAVLRLRIELDFRRLHDRQVGGLLALENAPGIDAHLTISILLHRSHSSSARRLRRTRDTG